MLRRGGYRGGYRGACALTALAALAALLSAAAAFPREAGTVASCGQLSALVNGFEFPASSNDAPDCGACMGAVGCTWSAPASTRMAEAPACTAARVRWPWSGGVAAASADRGTATSGALALCSGASAERASGGVTLAVGSASALAVTGGRQ